MLALLMTIAVFASCKKDTEDEETTGGANTTVTTSGGGDDVEIDYRALLPEAYYDNCDFNVLAVDGRQSMFEYQGDSLADADILAEAIYTRNTYVEDTYGVTFSFTWPKSRAEYNSAVAAAVASGDCEYDLVLPDYYYGVETTGYLQNLKQFEVLRFENPYWAAGWNDKAELNGIMYSAVGYYNLDLMSSAMAIFCNEYVAKDLKISEDIFNTVKSGNWTLETMKEYMKQYTEDYGNDGVYDFNDTYGLGYNLWSGRAFLAACGLELARFENGTVTFQITSQTNSDIFDAVNEFLTSDNLSYYGGRSGWDAFDGDKGDRKVFEAGRALFEAYTVNYGSTVGQKFEQFSIYPMPKLNEDQKSFITPLLGSCVQGILKGAKNPEMSATILETLNILSYLDVRPVYYDKILKTRFQNSAEKAEIMDVIISSVKVNFEFINTAYFSSIADKPFDALDPKKETELGGKGYFSAMGPVEKAAKIQLENFLLNFTEEAAE